MHSVPSRFPTVMVGLPEGHAHVSSKFGFLDIKRQSLVEFPGGVFTPAVTRTRRRLKIRRPFAHAEGPNAARIKHDLPVIHEHLLQEERKNQRFLTVVQQAASRLDRLSVPTPTKPFPVQSRHLRGPEQQVHTPPPQALFTSRRRRDLEAFGSSLRSLGTIRQVAF